MNFQRRFPLLVLAAAVACTSLYAGQNSNNYSYNDNIESAGASFHPTQKLTFNAHENYTSNLSGYLTQNLGTGGATSGRFPSAR